MRQFVKRKLALFDWIHQLSKSDQIIAYRIYTLLDHIRLYSRIPYLLSLIFVGIPFLFSFPTSAVISNVAIQCILASASYSFGILLFSRLVFQPLCRSRIRELQEMFYKAESLRVLNLLIPLDQDLEKQTSSLLKPPYHHPHRRARHFNV